MTFVVYKHIRRQCESSMLCYIGSEVSIESTKFWSPNKFTMYRKLLLIICFVALGFFLADAKKPKKKLPQGKKARDTCVGHGQDRICLKVNGKSGSFSISRAGNETVMVLDAIKEKGKDGKEVGKSGGKDGKHSFNNFAQLDFEFTDVENTTYKGIKAVGFTFSAVLPGPNATLEVPVLLFTENGTLNLCDDEQIEIKKGFLKYNIELSGWDFCKEGSGCGKKNKEAEIGAFVDFVMTVKSKKRGKKQKKGKKPPKGEKRLARKFFFGNHTSMSIPSAINSDGNCTTMEENYPDMVTKRDGSGYSITFRFPKFNDKVLYDPVVNEGGDSAAAGSLESEVLATEAPTVPPTTGSRASMPVSSLGIAMMLALLVRLFV